MASVMSAIQTQLVTDIETTSVNKCHVGAGNRQTAAYPHAELHWMGGEVTDFLTNVQDRDAPFRVIVSGSSTEQVELALEELIELWRSAAKLAVLQALGVTILYADLSDTGPYYAGSTTQQPVLAEVEFAMVVRYTT